MTDDQRKKYEEAAKAAFNENKSGNIHLWTVKEDDPDAIYWREVWTRGAAFASQDTEERVKQAHNEAIEKAIELINRCPSHFYSDNDYRQVTEEIQKLKL